MRKPAPQPYKERFVFDPSAVNGAFSVIKQQDVTEVLRAAHELPDLIRKDSGPAQGRYLGTVPVIIAEQWAKECDAAIGTKEWAAYAKKKLADGEYRRLRIHG